MLEKDQAVRGRINAEGETPELLEEESRIDVRNTARMKPILDEFGWPTQSMVGTDGARAAWLLAMHADHDTKFQRRCLKLIKAAFEHGEASAVHVAYLTDRVRARELKPQVYGTQSGVIDGVRRYFPIEDLKHVEERRAEVGLPPLGEYRELPKSLVITWGRPRPGGIDLLIGDVQDLIDAAVLDQEGNGLLGILNLALGSVQDNPRSAIPQLNAFITAVEGFISGGLLTAEQGQPLIAAAQSIIDELSP